MISKDSIILRMMALVLALVTFVAVCGFRACSVPEIRENVITATDAIEQTCQAILASIPPDDPRRVKIEDLRRFNKNFLGGFNSGTASSELTILLADLVTGFRVAIAEFMSVSSTVAFLLIAADISLRLLVASFKKDFGAKVEKAMSRDGGSVGFARAVSSVGVLNEYLSSVPDYVK